MEEKVIIFFMGVAATCFTWVFATWSKHGTRITRLETDHKHLFNTLARIEKLIEKISPTN